ncbi:MAG: ABC transporter ATP-binding protein [Bacteroidetes bacterium]|nr:ABC transporter ATP-binding protein [Bacteroidota bacterium]MBK9525336.1 ABC transporter ATP-binding protein [Bacteroidota bacterium]MBP6401270.1 ABC transporter ATP-binding protein [Bacteroidia bacterium]
MIKASGIQKSYEALKVLKGIELTIPTGEIVSIVGASGAGKSTLLHILGTLDTADSGKVTIDDVEITSLSARKLALFRNQKIGFVFQSHHLLPEFNALENVMMPALIFGSSKKEASTKASYFLDLLGLSERLTHRPSELSGGEQQRVAVARALVNGPSVVFADEPSGNLDSASAKALHKLFLDLRQQLKHTFVIVTHNEELAGMADRKLVMKDGLLVNQN